MMVTVACSGPEGATSVTLRSKNMLFFANIAREKAGEKVTNEEKLRQDRLTSPDYAMGFADKIRDQLLDMIQKNGTNLPADAILITDTLTNGFEPIYEHIVKQNAVA